MENNMIDQATKLLELENVNDLLNWKIHNKSSQTDYKQWRDAITRTVKTQYKNIHEALNGIGK